MRAGDLIHRMRIERRSETQAANGETVVTWGTVANRRARVLDLSGRELSEAQKIEARVTSEVHLRYYSGLTPTDRIVKLDADDDVERTLNIVSALNPDGRRIWMVCLCMEGEE